MHRGGRHLLIGEQDAGHEMGCLEIGVVVPERISERINSQILRLHLHDLFKMRMFPGGKSISTKVNKTERRRPIAYSLSLCGEDMPTDRSGRRKSVFPIARFNSASIESKPGPNANTIKATSR